MDNAFPMGAQAFQTELHHCFIIQSLFSPGGASITS